MYTLTDSRAKTATYKYSAWGETMDEYDSNTSSPNPIKYSGEYEDSESGMIYLRGRYYDPELRRFITEDPAQDGLNWYVYAANNPVILADPWGLAAGDEFYSIEEFLTDAYECYYGITDYTKLEIGSVIYTYQRINEETGDQETVYSYTEPRKGDLVSINLKDCQSDLKEGQELYGYIHSHSKINDNMDYISETFSPIDNSFINTNKKEGTPLYLMTPNGNMRALYSTGTNQIASNSNQRYEGDLVLTGLKFKEMNAFEKVQTFVVLNEVQEEGIEIIRRVLDDSKITESDTWYSAEDIQNLQIVKLYNILSKEYELQ